MKQLILIFSILQFAQSSLADENKISDKQIIHDCKQEAIAVGLQGADMKEYIEECFFEFTETDLGDTNIKLPSSG